MRFIYDRTIANIILNGEKPEIILAKQEMKQGCPLYPLLLNILLEFLSRIIRQEKEIKRIQIWKEEVKLSLVAFNMKLYLIASKNSIKQVLLIINTFRNVAGYKINIEELVAFSICQ
jgi:hypothetical protein